MEQRPGGLGRHLLADFYNCRFVPADAEALRAPLEEAARQIGATVVQSLFHAFHPYGLSGVVVIAESHLAVHTWPEHHAVCVDLFTCSPRLDPKPGFEHLERVFQSEGVTIVEVARGGELDRFPNPRRARTFPSKAAGRP